MTMRAARSATVSSLTVHGYFQTIKRIARWMVKNDLWRLSELTGLDMVEFLRTRQLQDGSPVTEKTLISNFAIFRHMWRLRAKYVAGLRFDPEVYRLPLALLPRRQNDRWRPLPDDQALPLIKDALWWLEHIAPHVLSASDHMWSMARRLIGKEPMAYRKIRDAHFLSAESTEDLRIIREAMEDYEQRTSEIIRMAIQLTAGACVTVLLFLVGLRSGELSALNTGSLKRIKHSDGEQYEYLSGLASKKSRRDRDWVVTEPVRLAVETLEALYKETRKRARGSPLLAAYLGNGPFVMPGRKVFRVSGTGVAQLLRGFVTARFRKVKISSRIHPHRARHTFARFVVRRNKRGLEPLAEHFGHVHRMITDKNYVTKDLALQAMLSEEDRLELRQCLSDLLTSSNIGGKAGAALEKARQEASSVFRGKNGLVSLIDNLVAKGVRLAPCDWGYCVYVREFSSCKGSSSGPDETNRSPTVCGGCANFAVTEVHRPWWEERYSREEQFLKRADILTQTRLLVTKRQNVTARILAALNDAKAKGNSGSE